MGNVAIKKDKTYADSNIAIVGLTRNAYGRPQYILVSHPSRPDKLKFPGAKFNAPKEGETIEDVISRRFTDQTGLTLDRSLGLRAIIPSRFETGTWMFRNVFVGVVNSPYKGNNDGRDVFVADSGQGIRDKQENVFHLGDSERKVPIDWSRPEDWAIASAATSILDSFDWKNMDTTWYKRIPTFAAPPLTDSASRPLGCALAVSSMMLIYQPPKKDQMHAILLKRKSDKFPGFPGGKIETLRSHESTNLDPISCCMVEGSEELGFSVQPRALIGCAVTPLHVPEGQEDTHYNSIVNYSFVAEPTNPYAVEKALANPEKHLERKMEAYVVERLDSLRDRVMRRELRMPDNVSIAEYFFSSGPGDRIPLTHMRSSGVY